VPVEWRGEGDWLLDRDSNDINFNGLGQDTAHSGTGNGVLRAVYVKWRLSTSIGER
jgi:hypothetical protein